MYISTETNPLDDISATGEVPDWTQGQWELDSGTGFWGCIQEHTDWDQMQNRVLLRRWALKRA